MSPAGMVAIAETVDGAEAAQAPRRGRNGVEHRNAVAEPPVGRRLRHRENPRQGDDITQPTSPALAWAVRLRCSKALAGGLNGRLTHKAVI